VLPNKCQALGSIHSTTKKKREKKKKKRKQTYKRGWVKGG
jgi:hypothetical protein